MELSLKNPLMPFSRVGLKDSARAKVTHLMSVSFRVSTILPAFR